MQKIKIRKSITIDPHLFDAAHKIASAHRRSFSNLVSLLLEKMLAEKN